MVSWRMPDGTEIVCLGVQVDTGRLREFVVRFMSAEGAGWNATRWSETLFASAFEERFGVKVQIHRTDGPDGHRMFAIGTVRDEESGASLSDLATRSKLAFVRG